MWSTYLEQFHRNIKYNIGSTKYVIDCLSHPPFSSLTMVRNYCSQETSGWTQLYERDHDFTSTYQMLDTNTIVTDFHL
jgi:hypothetical protein